MLVVGRGQGPLASTLKFFSSLEMRRLGDWSGNPQTAQAMRDAVALIGEATFSDDGLSAHRKQEILDAYYEPSDEGPVPKPQLYGK